MPGEVCAWCYLKASLSRALSGLTEPIGTWVLGLVLGGCWVGVGLVSAGPPAAGWVKLPRGACARPG